MGNGNAELREYRHQLLQQLMASLTQVKVASTEAQNHMYLSEMEASCSAICCLLREHGVDLPAGSPEGDSGENNLWLLFISRLPYLLQELPAEAWSWTWRHTRFGVRTLQWWVERYLLLQRGWLSQPLDVPVETSDNP